MTCLFIVGTRPEFLKILPVLSQMSASCDIIITKQHPDSMAPIDLLRSSSGGNVSHRIHEIEVRNPGSAPDGRDELHALVESVRKRASGIRPTAIVVQGDTRTALAGALAARKMNIALAHIEAGLRTHDLSDPWPEEAYRLRISSLSTLHFAPTEVAKKNLREEGVEPSQIFVTGNTSVDLVEQWKVEAGLRLHRQVRERGGRVIVTLHRNEAHGHPRRKCLERIRLLAMEYSDHQFIIVSHPNPIVQRDIGTFLRAVCTKSDNIALRSNMKHNEFLAEVSMSACVISDSGGIQEEAPSLGRRVFIARNTTERPEGLGVDRHRLIGRQGEGMDLVHEALIEDSLFEGENPFGDGRAGSRIAGILEHHEWASS